MKGPFLVLLVGNTGDLAPLFDELGEDTEWVLEHAANKEVAMSLVRTRPFDLIMADCGAAPEAAVLALRAVRGVRPQAKVIVFAPDSTSEKVISAIREHAFSYFSRPCDTSAVKAMILEAIRVPEWDHGIEVVSARPHFLSLRLRCRFSAADRLVQFLRELKTDLPATERTEVATAFREMILNAIEHGGKLDPDQWVRVSRIRTARTLVYFIQDPGEGFARDALQHAAVSNPPGDPIEHVHHRLEKGLRPGGFGMLIASRLVDEVIYNESGNEVILIKHLD